MRITGVDLSTDTSNVFSFSLNQVESNEKYLIKTIIGLDADELIHKFYGFGTATKPKFYNFSLTKRELVLRIVLNPNYLVNETFADIRDELYRAISSSRTGNVNLLFNSGGAVVAKISGFITKFEVPYFSKVPELQVTIRCDDPMFRGFSPVVLEAANLSNSNPVLVADSLSTAPHGFQLEVLFTGASANFTIQDLAASPEWIFQVTPSGGFLNGDTLVLSSEYGSQNLYMIRSAVTTPLMDKILPGSIWPTIFPGANEFHFPEIANFDWVSLTHYPAYWGV